MGQYYKPVNTETKEWLYSHAYDSGLKIMEHSWIGNDFVGAVMGLMVEGQPWHESPIVWSGDYYGGEGTDDEVDYYDQCEDDKQLKPKSMSKEDQKRAILVNHTKKQFVVYAEMPTADEWTVNPLPLLTACGNGRGGGDYYDQYADYDKVGIWANDILSIEFSPPAGYDKLVVKFDPKS